MFVRAIRRGLKRVRLHVLTRLPNQKVSPKLETNWGFGRSVAWSRCLSLVVVFQTQMGDQILATEIAQRVFELHQLDEYVMLRIESRGCLGRLEIEG